MLKMRVQVCDVFWSRRNASDSSLSVKIMVKSTFPLIDPMTVSSSHVTFFPSCLRCSHISLIVRPMRHLAFVLVTGFLCGFLRVPAKGRSCFFALNSPSAIHP